MEELMGNVEGAMEHTSSSAGLFDLSEDSLDSGPEAIRPIQMGAGEIVELLPRLSPALSETLLRVLQEKCLIEDFVVLHVERLKMLVPQVCEGFAAELQALLGSSSSLGGGSGAVEQGGGASDVVLQQLRFCLLLALAPSLPDARHISITEGLPEYSCYFEQAVEVLCSALVSEQWSNGVRQLSIQGNGGAFQSDRGSEHLAHLLESEYCKLQRLKMLGLLGDRGVRHIARALQTNHSLTTLEIELCPLVGDDGVEQLAAMLRTNSTLRNLNLREIGMTAHGLRHLCDALGAETNSSLTALKIEDTMVGDDGVEQLAAMLRTNSTLEDLKLDNIGMTAHGLRHLCDGLQSTQQSRPPATSSSSLASETVGGLSFVDISWNKIGEGGPRLLGAMLANNRCLKLLDASSCSLVEEDGEGHLAEGMRENSTLEALNISNNPQLSKVALGLLVRSLASNTALRTLKMKGMGEMPAAQELADMLISNDSLTKLECSKASYDAEEWATIILPALHRNKTLLYFDLQKCSGVGGEQVRAALFDLLRINTTIQEIKLFDTPLYLAGEAEAVEVELRRNKQFRHALSSLPQAKPKSCRIILCGHAYAGKTSLLQAMKRLQVSVDRSSVSVGNWCCLELLLSGVVGSCWELLSGGSSQNSNNNNNKDMELSKRTRGIDIQLVKNEPDLRISAWDLAGQREFHALHDCVFPTGNNAATLFVLTLSPLVSPAGGLKATDLKSNRELEQELHYWLQFIASNFRPGAAIPSVVVVITHKDTLAQLKHVPLWLLSAGEIVNRLATKFSGRVNVERQPVMVDVLRDEDGELTRWVGKTYDMLKKTLESLENEPAICDQVLKTLQEASQTGSKSPIVSRAEFTKICRSLALAQNKGEESESEGADSETQISEAVADKLGKAVAAYLHNAGEVIYHDNLDLIVSNPRWFCQGVLGQLVDPWSSESSQGQKNLQPERPKNGLVSKTFLSGLLQEAVKCVPGLDPEVVTPEQLIQLMLLLNLCYEQKRGDPNTDYFLPAIFEDKGNKATHGERPLTWRELATYTTFVGRRLQCGDLERTFLTDGFFPRLQVVLHNYALEAKWVDDTYSSNYMLEKNLISIWFNGMEILIEFSGSSGYFVDILVKSSKSPEETMEFLRPNIIGTIRTFCASHEGCKGVTLAEAIIRPDCLYGADGRNPILCTFRREQSILVKELTDKMKRIANYEHCWDKVVDGAGGLVLEYGKDFGTALLEGSNCKGPNPRPEPNLNEVEEGCYPNNNWKQGKRRGMALIVSMESDRPGAGVDRGSMKTLAEACGFSPVRQEVDQEASKLLDTIKDVAKSHILEQDEGFMCSINGHGGTQGGQPYIVDENNVKIMVIRDIIEPFRRSNNLLGKPKVFFISCCRGKKLYGKPTVEKADHHTHDAQHDLDAHDDTQEQGGTGSLLPDLKELSDCLLVFSTSEGCPSCRYRDTGTIFVENLVNTVVNERQTTDVLNMMTRVNERVTEVQNPYKLHGTQVNVGQCCEARTFLRKKLYWKGA